MPSVKITLTDVTDDTGRQGCRADFVFDRNGYPLDAPPSPALLRAAAIRMLGEMGVIDRLMPLIESKLQFDELTAYLKQVGALDDAGNLTITPVRLPDDYPDSANITDLQVVDGVAS